MWDDGEVTSDQLTDLNKFRKDRLNKAARLGFGPLAHQVVRERSRSRERMRKVIDNAPRPPMLKQQLAQRQAVKRSVGDEPDISAFLAPKPVKGIVLSKAAQARLAAEAAGRMNNAPGKYVQKEDRYSVDALEASAAASAAAFRSQTPQATTPSGFVQRDETIAAAFATTREEIHTQYVLKDPEERRAVAVSSGARAKAKSAPGSKIAPEDAALDRLKGKASRNSKAAEDRSDDAADSDDDSDDRGLQTATDDKQRLKREKKKRNEWRRKWRADQKKRSRKKNDDSSEEDESSDRDDSSEERDAETIARKAREANSDAVGSNVRRNYSGQMSDRELEKRLKEQAEDKGAKLMSEAEVLAKIQRNRKR